MAKGEKLTAKIQYKKDAFGYLDSYKQSRNLSSSSYNSGSYNSYFIIIVIAIIILISIGGGGGYYGHRGFYGGYYGRGYYGGGCVHSSCACAGSGRAGCSKKDFYGTKINKDKLKKAFKDN